MIVNGSAGGLSQGTSGGSAACRQWSSDTADNNHSLAERQEYLLASMRSARANLQSWQFALDEIGLALKQGIISLDTACAELAELGLLRDLPQQERAA
jgi:hypothetical protein